MELNSKKLERTQKIVYFCISALLCGFLILLSNTIIGDLEGLSTEPTYEQFSETKMQKQLDFQMAPIQAKLDAISEKRQTISNALSVATQNYETEKQSFDNWLEARKTVGSPTKDAEVISRAEKLDEINKVKQEWETKDRQLQEEYDKISEETVAIQNQREIETAKIQSNYQSALNSYELKVFGIRLLFVLPILGIGIFFFIKYRKHKFSPLFMGFSMFSLYCFFFGLVPYLPSYGGYVRYIIGVLLSVGIGYYAIKRIRTYIEEKQKELETSSKDRAKNVHLQTAEKALDMHICPSCGKDFILKKWDTPLAAVTDMYKLATNFCRFCGLELFKICPNCNTKNFAHIPYCSCCGEKVNQEKTN